MNDVISVTESDTLDHLINKLSQPAWVDASIILLKDFKQILFYVFEYQV